LPATCFLLLSAVLVAAADGTSAAARKSSLRGAAATNGGGDVDPRVLQGTTAENARVKVTVVTASEEEEAQPPPPPAPVYDPNMPVNRVGPNAKPGVSSAVKIKIVKRGGERDEGEEP